MKKISWQYHVLFFSWLFYGLTTILVVGTVGPSIVIASLIPILISGLVLGMKGGVLSGVLVTVYNMIFLGFINPPFITVFGNFPLWFGSAIGIMIGGVVGRVRDLGMGLREKDIRLGESEERFRRSLDNLPEGCHIVGFDRKWRYVNDAVVERLGIERQNLLGKTGPEIGLVNLAPNIHPAVEKCLDERVPADLEVEVVYLDGRVRWLEFSIRPVPEGAFVLSRDRTERRKGEEKVLESERRYRQLFDSSAVGNWSQDITNIRSRLDKLRNKGIKDLREYFSKYPEETRRILRSARIRDVNQTALEIFGADSKDEIRNGEAKIFSKVPLETRIDYLATIAEGGHHWEMETKCNTLDGREIDVRTYSSIPGRDHDPQLLIMSVIDITVSKRHESDKLSAVGKATASIAHDIRNPLTAIRTAGYVIRDAPPKKRREMLDILDNNVVKADNIIQGLMDYSSPAPLKIEEVDFNRTLDEIIAQCVIPKNVKLVKNYEKVSRIKFDSNQMARAFTNLIMNALQAMPRGGRLTVSAKQVDGFIETQVKDTGVGIPKENLAKLFTPFFTTKSRGTGLGLLNAEAIIKRHGGTLKVVSVKNKSTTVTVRLPSVIN